jgi:hypothetical protein
VSDELANLFAKRYIARKDVKAVQHRDGSWAPVTKNGKRDGERLGWTRADLLAHLDGSATYGHYLLDTDSTCKLFAFDIDLEKNSPNFTGMVPQMPMEPDTIDAWEQSFTEADAREIWRDRAHPGRDWMKLQFHSLAHRLVAAIENELAIPCAVAYSGAKGIHVYGFTGVVPADEAREGAMIVLDSLSNWKPSRGTNFFRCEDGNPVTGYPNLSIELFPKQAALDGKDLGNLMRMPLGRNLKAPDPTFFIDMRAPMNELTPVDPIWALTTPSQFA